MWVLKMTATVDIGLRVSFVSAVYSYSAWRDALPAHHEVCDCVEGEQDLGPLCFTPYPLTLQPLLANGKHIMQQYHHLGKEKAGHSLQNMYDYIIRNSTVCWEI